MYSWQIFRQRNRMNKTTWIILAITGVTALTAIADAFFKFASEREQSLLEANTSIGRRTC
jgi:hypothetical protein